MSLMNEYNKIMDEFKEEFPARIFEDREAYADWLAQTYYFVCHSTALLGFALPHLKDKELKHRFEKHIGEEERHELLAIKDLEKLGYTLEDFPEHAVTQAFYQSQYYRIQFEGGSSLLGYILLLEGLAVHWGSRVYQHIQNDYPGSLIFLRVHTTEDPEHLDQAVKAILSLPQSEQDAIKRNLFYSKEMYKGMLRAMIQNKKTFQAA